MGFIDSYKRLEKLCGEILNDDRRISAYIDEMVNTPRGMYLVSGWDADLKQLKHYRWIRNQIVHDPNCSEENMCAPEDTQWINEFHSRIMNQTDPLALYRKATQSHSKSTSYESSAQAYSYHGQTSWSNKSVPRKPIGCAFALMCLVLIVVATIILFAF